MSKKIILIITILLISFSTPIICGYVSINELIGKETDSDKSVINAYEEKSSNEKLTKAYEQSIMRRKGLYDKNTHISSQRVLYVGLWPVDNYYNPMHDLISRGIPFHMSTFTHFVQNYQEWTEKYDIVVFGGEYIESDSVSPDDVKKVVIDSLEKGLYKFIQISDFGMRRGNYDTTFWFKELGLLTTDIGELYSTDIGSTSRSITENGVSILAEDKEHTVNGWWQNVTGDYNIKKLAFIPDSDLCLVSAKEEEWVCIARELDYFSSYVDLGKIVYYLRDIRSHVCYNRYYGQKYVAWGWDGDVTKNINATNNIVEISQNRPVEIGIVTSRLDGPSKENYLRLQEDGHKIISHSVTHFEEEGFDDTQQWIQSISDLEENSIKSDGICYMTGPVNRVDVLKRPIEMGHLICGYTFGLYGRNSSNFPLGNTDQLKTSIQMGGAPIFGTTGSDDIYNLGQNGTEAFNYFVERLMAADKEPYSLPLIFYFHDTPLDISWNSSKWTDSSAYYHSSNGIGNRKEYYTKVFEFIDQLGYKQLRRSEANELINDIMNCVAITGEEFFDFHVLTKYVSTRSIKGLTFAVPIDSERSIESVKLDGKTLDKSLWTKSNEWVYVGVDSIAGQQSKILVKYSDQKEQ